MSFGFLFILLLLFSFVGVFFFFLRIQEYDIQEKINFEIRMREGICKLLAVSTQKDQLLQVVKNLMVCNARILAYRAELQKQPGEPVSCGTEGR